jgi:hypothetical protein
MLAEMLLQELFRDFGFHIKLSLFLDAGTAYIQAVPIFFDMLTDALQCRAASRAADMKGIWRRIAVPDAEPEVVRDHLLKPHTAPALDCVAVGGGDHSHLLRPFSVAVDEWVVTDLVHGLHRPSVLVEEAASAVSQGLRLRTEEHSGEAALHLPDVILLVAGYRYGHTTLVLEQRMAVIGPLGKVPGVEVLDTRLLAVEKVKFHICLLS